MNRYSIRKIFVWPAFKFGALIGAVLMILPGIACGLLTRSMVHALRTFVEAMGWLALGDRDMAAFAQRVVALDARGVMLIVWTALATIVIGGLLYGAGAALAALLYNLIARISGGLLVGAEAVAMPAPAAPAAPAPAVAPQVPQQAAPAYQPPAPAYQPPPQAQPGPWLAMGPNLAQRWPLRPDRTRLGSGGDNDIVMPGTAPNHAEIRFENGVYVLYDLAAGQTWVNNRAVAGRNMLKEGFVIRLGGQEMVFHAS